MARVRLTGPAGPAFADLAQRLEGRAPVEWSVGDVVAGRGRKQTVYRDRETGRFASASSWKVSRAQSKGRPGRFARGRVTMPGGPVLRNAERATRETIDDRLRKVGVGPVEIRLRGFIVEPGKTGETQGLRLKVRTAGGLDLPGLLGMTWARIRDLFKERGSDIAVFLEELEVEDV